MNGLNPMNIVLMLTINVCVMGFLMSITGIYKMRTHQLKSACAIVISTNIKQHLSYQVVLA